MALNSVTLDDLERQNMGFYGFFSRYEAAQVYHSQGGATVTNATRTYGRCVLGSRLAESKWHALSKTITTELEMLWAFAHLVSFAQISCLYLYLWWCIFSNIALYYAVIAVMCSWVFALLLRASWIFETFAGELRDSGHTAAVRFHMQAIFGSCFVQNLDCVSPASVM